MTGYERAIDAAGSASELARRITNASGKAISLQAVLKWAANGIPAERCAIVEKVTGVSRSLLNDLFATSGDQPKRKKAA